MYSLRLAIGLVFAASLTACGPSALSPKMSFFVTSRGLGDGGNLGGIAGADALCSDLAAAVGSTRTWRAYLSAPASGATPAVHAHDRIGAGPWFNHDGIEISASLTSLHSDNSGIDYSTALTETGRKVSGSVHDILTGSDGNGRLSTRAANVTCDGWTSNRDGSRAMLGHTDGMGGQPGSRSWNAAHMSNGCSEAKLHESGGEGRLYCFAVD